MFFPAIITTNIEQCSGTNAKRRDQLQKSLAEILTIYYPLAGGYIDDKYSIDCNDKGAEYVEAQISGCSLSEFIKTAELEGKLRNLLLPYMFQQQNNPLLAVQFNVFKCGGVAIGVSLTHRLGDAFTSLTFIDVLATSSRLGIHEVRSSPSFALGSISPPREISISSTVDVPRDETKVAERSFLFNGAAIAKLKAIANADCNDPELRKHQPKGVELVTAPIWKAFMSLSQARHGHFRHSVSVFPFNMRGKTGVLLPGNCCGNLVCLAVGQEFTLMNDHDEVQVLHDMVSYVRKTARRAYEECAKAKDAEELFLTTTNAVEQWNEATKSSKVDVFVFNNLQGLPMHKIDFGWGMPDRVKIGHYPLENNVFFLLLFQENPDIMAYTNPTGHGRPKL